MLTVLFRVLACLPLAWLHAIGALTGRIVLFWSKGYRRHLMANLAQAGLLNERLMRRVAEEMGKGILELPYVWLRPPRDVVGKIKAANWPLVEAARATAQQTGKGVIFLTPHLGCFEVTGQYLADTPAPDGAALTAMYRPPRKSWLRPLVERGRSRHNLHAVPADLRGVRQMVRVLKRGEAICILPDQVPNKGEGVWAPFFGRPAFTITLPARLQNMTGARIVLMYGERLPKGQGWIVHFHPLDETLSGTPEQQAGQINRAMESLIRRCPDQYYWSYNRYKTPRAASTLSAINEGDLS